MSIQTQIPDFSGGSFPRAQTDMLHIDGHEAVETFHQLTHLENALKNLEGIDFSEIYEWVKNGTADSYFQRGAYETNPVLQFDPFLKMLCEKAAQGLSESETIVISNEKIQLMPYTFDIVGVSKHTAMPMEVLAYMLCQPYPVRCLFCPGLFFIEKENQARNFQIFKRSVERLIVLLKETLLQAYEEVKNTHNYQVEM